MRPRHIAVVLAAWAMAPTAQAQEATGFGLAAFQQVVIDSEATGYGTFQSHNQKVVSNANGIFTTHIRSRNDAYTEQQWRLSRSVDGGRSFRVVYEATDGTNPPTLETDADANLYLVRQDYTDYQAYAYRFLAAEEYTAPHITHIVDGGGGKYSMVLDAVRGVIHYFAQGRGLFHLTLDGQTRDVLPLWVDGEHARIEYPHSYLDRGGVLHAAWTSSKLGEYLYWDIHYMASADGGQTWHRFDGSPLSLPQPADETGATDRITWDDEFEVHTWLSSFLVKDGKAHFLYQAHHDPVRQHYMRYDLVTGQRDLDVQPQFRGQQIVLEGLDGFFATRPDLADGPLYVVGHAPGGRLGCLASDDNGSTWYDYALSPPGLIAYAVGGCRELTADGAVIGTYTNRFLSPDGLNPYRVEFLKLQAGLATAQGLVGVDTSGGLRVRFQSVHGQPEAVRFWTGAWSAWIPFADTMGLASVTSPTRFQLRSRLGVVAAAQSLPPVGATWSARVRAVTALGQGSEVRFGVAPGATDGLDADLGESELPPAPPTDALDLRWETDWPVLGLASDYRGPAADTAGASWALTVQANSADLPVVLTWSPGELSSHGQYRLVDAASQGQAVDLDPRQRSSVEISTPGLTRLVLRYQLEPVHRITWDLPGRWSLVSLPVAVPDPALTRVFPAALGLFGFAATYRPESSFAPGVGYWLNLSEPQQQTVSGTAFPDSVLARSLPSHWSLIAPGRWALDTAALREAYPQIVSLYGYDGGYQQAAVMEPGRAYWVNLRAPSTLDLSGRLARAAARPWRAPPPALPVATLWAEGPGGRQAMALGGPVGPGAELPPPPPPPLFDVRAEVGRGLTAVVVPAAAGAYAIRRQGVSRLAWDLPATGPWWLEVRGTAVPLAGRGEIAVRDEEPVRLQYQPRPPATVLEAAYPNPFNPATTIRYILASAGQVRLAVYAVNGQQVRELVASFQAAGAYEMLWDGKDDRGLQAGNGLYLCQLRTATGRQVTRLILAK